MLFLQCLPLPHQEERSRNHRTSHAGRDPKDETPQGVELQEPREPQLCWESALPARARRNPAGKPPLGAALRAELSFLSVRTPIPGRHVWPIGCPPLARQGGGIHRDRGKTTTEMTNPH